MEVYQHLIISFVALLGLQICVPENPNGKFEAQLNEKFWTENPYLRLSYGLTNIIGALFVLGSVGYLTFCEHWWYIIVYIIALPIAKVLAYICKCVICLLWRKSQGLENFSRIRKQRIVGCLIVIVAIISFITNL